MANSTAPHAGVGSGAEVDLEVHRLRGADRRQQGFQRGRDRRVTAHQVRADTPQGSDGGPGGERERERPVLHHDLAPGGVLHPGEKPVPVLGEPGRVARLAGNARPDFQCEVRVARQVGVQAEPDRVADSILGRMKP